MDEKVLIAQRRQLLEEALKTLTDPSASAEDIQAAVQKKEAAKSIEARIEQVRELTKSLEEQSRLMGEAMEQHPTSTPFRSLGHFLYEVALAGNVRASRRRPHPALKAWRDLEEEKADQGKWEVELAPEAKATMGETIGARGGFLVPQEYRADLFGIAPEGAIVRPRATIIPMARRQVALPAVDQTGATGGQPHWFGGIVAQWTEESAMKSQTDPTWRQIILTAHKLVCYTRSSDELLEDSAISLEAWLRSPLGFPGAIQFQEDYAFLRGTGTGQPLGIINAGATITVARQTANTIGVADLANMYEVFLASGGRGVWIITQSAMADLIQLSGPTGNPSYFWQPNGQGGVPGTLLGLPVIWTEKLPRIGTVGDVVLANLPYYYVGDRVQATIEATNVERFQYDETSWRAVHRVDGQPALSAPLTLQDGVTQVSPFVILGNATT